MSWCYVNYGGLWCPSFITNKICHKNHHNLYKKYDIMMTIKSITKISLQILSFINIWFERLTI